MSNQLFLAERGGQRIAVNLQGYTWGQRAFAGIHIAGRSSLYLVGNPADLVLELRKLAASIEAQSCRETKEAIIHAEAEPETIIHFSRSPQLRQPQMTDLTGDPSHDWPLFVKRFGRKSLDVLVAAAEYYKRSGAKVPAVEAILNAFDDLESVWPLRSKILDQRGEVLHGGRSAIARKLGVKDAGNYRARIDSVIWLLKNYPDGLLEENDARLEDSTASVRPFAAKPAKSNPPEQQLKVANG